MVFTSTLINFDRNNYYTLSRINTQQSDINSYKGFHCWTVASSTRTLWSDNPLLKPLLCLKTF